MHLGKTLCLSLLLTLALAASASATVTVLEEHVNGGVTQLTWLPGFNTQRTLLGLTLDASSPAYANPSGDHTVGSLTTAVIDSGGLALSCVDPQGQVDYVWEGWVFTGDSNSRRGLIVRADPTNEFTSCYQFVLYSGNSQLAFRKLIGQTPTPLRSWIGPAIPGGIPTVNTWHKLKVEAIGNQFRCWWDDVEVTSVSDPIVDSNSPLMSGFVGVYNFRPDISNLTTFFDDLVLTTSDPVPTSGRTWGNLKALYR
jgi:hypothetical protein